MDSQGSFGKPETEQDREEEEQEAGAEEEEEEEQKVEEEAAAQQEGAGLQKELEIFGGRSAEDFWKFWDLGGADEEDWPRARLVSIVTPSLSPTLPLRTPSQTSVPTSSISSQKSTAPHAEPFPLRLPGP